MAASLSHVIFTATAVIHLTRCEECMYGNCMPNGEWHTWAGNEDLDYAKANGQDVDAILKQRCACDCEDGPGGPEEPDFDGDEENTLDAPCTECGETTACATDYDGTWCDYCGCCEHGEARDGIGCRADDAPDGMRCCGSDCGCEGTMGHIKPTKPPEAVDQPEADDTPRQLHQEFSLFNIGNGA